MPNKIRILEFDSAYQSGAAELINTGLGEHFGFVDEGMNPDLFDIASHYQDGDFLLALDGNLLVGTGSLMPISAEVGQIARMHTAAGYRRRGVATKMLNTLEANAALRGMRKLILETNLDWHDANAFYLRNGYQEAARNDVGIRYQKQLASAHH